MRIRDLIEVSLIAIKCIVALSFKIDNDFFKRFNVVSAFVLLTLELIGLLKLQQIDKDL